LLPEQFPTPLCHSASSLFSVETKKQYYEEKRKLNFFVRCAILLSWLFPLPLLPYVYVSTYLQICFCVHDSHRVRIGNRKKKISGVFCHHCCGNAVYRGERKKNTGKGIYW